MAKLVRANNEELRKVYNNIPKTYDRTNKLISFYQDVRWRTDLIKTLLKHVIGRDLKVLDVGSGRGELSYVLRKFNLDWMIVLLDYAENMLKSSMIEEDKILASFEYLPFRDNSFDIIMSSFALHAADDIEKVIKELWRVCKGLIAVIAMGKPKNKIIRLYISFYLKFIVPLLAKLVGANPKDYKYIYWIYLRNTTNDEYRKIFSKYFEITVYEERALNLFYFILGLKKKLNKFIT
jgi:demethylmenaquinone methyltransferase/2-methoxy-6-polyprenyl-1,4-benzoquinol methylase